MRRLIRRAFLPTAASPPPVRIGRRWLPCGSRAGPSRAPDRVSAEL